MEIALHWAQFDSHLLSQAGRQLTYFGEHGRVTLNLAASPPGAATAVKKPPCKSGRLLDRVDARTPLEPLPLLPACPPPHPLGLS